MNPPGKLAMLERLPRLHEFGPSPPGHFRGIVLLALHVFLPMIVLRAHGAITARAGTAR